MKRTFEELRRAEEKAVAGLITFARSERTHLTGEEVEAVEMAMEIAGCNVEASRGRTDRRRIEAQLLLRNCITPLDRSALNRVEVMLLAIAEG